LRGHFAELYTLLASREQQMQHELFQRFQERTGSLNNAKRHIRKDQMDFSKRLQKATNAVSSDIPPSGSAIARLTESIRQSNSCKNLVDETRENVNLATLSALFEPNEKYAHHLRHDPVATVRRIVAQSVYRFEAGKGSPIAGSFEFDFSLRADREEEGPKAHAHEFVSSGHQSLRERND
jgi:hypothetical protein